MSKSVPAIASPKKNPILKQLWVIYNAVVVTAHYMFCTAAFGTYVNFIHEYKWFSEADIANPILIHFFFLYFTNFI